MALNVEIWLFSYTKMLKNYQQFSQFLPVKISGSDLWICKHHYRVLVKTHWHFYNFTFSAAVVFSTFLNILKYYFFNEGIYLSFLPLFHFFEMIDFQTFSQKPASYLWISPCHEVREIVIFWDSRKRKERCSKINIRKLTHNIKRYSI